MLDVGGGAIRILVLTNLYPPRFIGGYELRCQSVVEGLRRLGHTVEVLTSRFGSTEPEPAEEDVLRRLHISHGPPYPPEDLKGFLEAELQDRLTLLRAIAEMRPDVVDVWGMEFASQSMIQSLSQTGLPIHFSLEDKWLLDGHARDPLCNLTQLASELNVEADPGIRHICCLGLTRPNSRHCSVTFASNSLARHYRDAGFDHPSTRVRIAGIDLTPFRRIERGSDPPPFVILCVGQLTASRGQADLIRAAILFAKRNDDDAPILVRFVGGGNAAYTEELQQLADETVLDNMSVDFVGPVHPEDVAQWYAKAHLFVHTSHLPEGLPRVLMEAMAAGVPVISTDSGGQRDILQDGRWGAMVPPGRPEVLAGQIRRCVKDYRGWIERAEQARQRALEAFDIDAYVQGHSEDLREAALQHPVTQADVEAHPPLQKDGISAFVSALADAAEEQVVSGDVAEDPDRAWRLGVVLKRCGRDLAALDVFTKLRERYKPDKAHMRRANFHLAELALVQRRWAEACVMLQACLAIAPDHAKAAYDLEYAVKRNVPRHLRGLVVSRA
ncbi:MAG: glycosyltransferase family 4 protein [Phycisphaerales bacterium]|nr:glycosyltransferase family 4 protein [Phycisphaerales bacterium]